VSYPQPNADQYAINGYQYFRLNTLLSSPGDIYESQQSSLALSLGPDSDISKVAVAYFDDQVPTFMQMTSIGSERTFVGRIDARNEVPYQPSNRPGRIFFWSDDLYDTSFRPPGFSVLNDKFNVVTPRLDVIQYFSTPPTLLPARNDKTYNFQNIVTGVSPTFNSYLMIPYWGRKYAMVELTNKSTGATGFSLSGVNFAVSPSSAGYTQITTIVADAPIGVNAQVSALVKSDAHGMFDMLMLTFHRVNAADVVMGPVRVFVSDSTTS
jgi:hypothetical protein